MPELPEVETVVRTLEKQIGCQKIKEADILYPRIVDNMSSTDFEKALMNQRFEEYQRRGKYLLFYLTDYVLVAHLRMEGKFYYYQQQVEPDRHTHAVFTLENGWLHYNDVRKFGRFYLYRKDEEIKAISSLGYEPWDERLTADYLKQYCRKIRLPIKSVLLQQEMIAGIGNIYADEICALACIHPLTPSCLLSRNKWDEIINATRIILKQAIEAGGTTIRSYTSSLGITGRFQQSLLVHSQHSCQKCGSDVIKIRVNGRGTYYCPVCQKKKPVTVAISGLIGSGKSTLTEIIADKGYKTISCDAVNALLLESEDVRKQLAEIFETDVGSVDKKYISSRIFSDDIIKGKVEKLLHALIWQKIEEFIILNEDNDIIFVEVPLLFETDWYRRFDCNLLVVASEKEVIERLIINRNITEQQARTVLAKQKNNEEKIRLADYIINNDEGLDKLEKMADKFIEDILRIVRNQL